MSRYRLFLHAYSFEERSVEGIRRALSNTSYDMVVSVNYENVPKALRVTYDTNRVRALWHIERTKVQHQEITSPTYNQFDFVEQVERLVRTRAAEVDFDISCFTKLHILRLLRSLYGRVRTVEYIGADTHQVSSDQRIRIGHQECVQVAGYEGLHKAAAPSLLVLILGFEGDRALASYLELDPAMAVAVVGCPWIEPARAIDYVEGALRNNGALLRHHDVFSELAPSLSAKDFASRLRDIVQEYRVRARQVYGEAVNVTVVPLGTKIQCLGLYFFWTLNPYVRVMYPMPYEYQLVARGVGRTITTELREFGRTETIKDIVEKKLVDILEEGEN